MIVKLLTEHHLEFLSLNGGCRGSSESTHVKMPHCWKSHALAQITEDEKPLKEIDFSGVISKLINWRPPCLFGSLPADSDEESDTEIDSNTISLAPLDLGKIIAKFCYNPLS